MIFCGIELMPGQKERVPLPVPGAQSLDTVCLCGTALGKTLVVTAGVHGCEYVGVQALRRLAAELDPAELSGNVIFLPLANPTGFYAGAKRVVPEDGVNLNRAFPGDPAAPCRFGWLTRWKPLSIRRPTSWPTFTAGTATRRSIRLCSSQRRGRKR